MSNKERNDSDQHLQDSLSELSNPTFRNSDSNPPTQPKHKPPENPESDDDSRRRENKKRTARQSLSESDSDDNRRKRGRSKRRARESSSESESKSEAESGRRGKGKRRVRESSSESDSDSVEDSRKRGKRKRRVRESSLESDSVEDRRRRRRRHGKRKSRKRDSSSGSESESGSDSESESERRRRKRREMRKREEERERKRRKREKERKKRKKEKKKERVERGKKGAVTNSWGKYGIVKETEMWNKRPEFTAWLAEVKQVNLESLSNWEEKKMFKEYMEDYNTATFPSKKYYNLDAYYRRQMEKEQKKGFTKVLGTVRTVFNDEEQRRIELLREREKQKEQEVEALKHSMQSGLAQAMKEQQRLREEMAYQYKIGNFEAAAAIQRRLDPDAAM